MPYISPKDRERYFHLIEDVVSTLVNKLPADNGKEFSEGDLNYIISSIMWKLFEKSPSYRRGNTLVGVLECVKQEFYRRQLAPYEDTKIIFNGDL